MTYDRTYDKTCLICFEEIDDDDYWKCEQCICNLHVTCYEKWKNGCPMCKLNRNHEPSCPPLLFCFIFLTGCLVKFVDFIGI